MKRDPLEAFVKKNAKVAERAWRIRKIQEYKEAQLKYEEMINSDDPTVVAKIAEIKEDILATEKLGSLADAAKVDNVCHKHTNVKRPVIWWFFWASKGATPGICHKAIEEKVLEL